MPRNKALIKTTLPGIDFTADFFTLRHSQLTELHDAAKACGYRQPANANGSLARYFFAYLNREPKTELVHIVQGFFGYGWEDVTAEVERKEARARLHEYRENDPQHQYRLIRRREAV